MPPPGSPDPTACSPMKSHAGSCCPLLIACGTWALGWHIQGARHVTWWGGPSWDGSGGGLGVRGAHWGVSWAAWAFVTRGETGPREPPGTAGASPPFACPTNSEGQGAQSPAVTTDRAGPQTRGGVKPGPGWRVAGHWALAPSQGGRTVRAVAAGDVTGRPVRDGPRVSFLSSPLPGACVRITGPSTIPGERRAGASGLAMEARGCRHPGRLPQLHTELGCWPPSIPCRQEGPER